MKRADMAIFFIIVLSIYFLVNFYIFIRGWQALSSLPSVRPYYLGLFLILSLSYIAGRIAEHNSHTATGDVLIWMGSFWLGAMLYLFLFVLFIDLFRLFAHFVNFRPALLMSDPGKTRLVVFASVALLTSALCLYGFVNARGLNVKTLDIKLRKGKSKLHTLNVVLLSDLHLGNIIGRRHLGRIVEKVNRIKPDIVLMAGDVIDENIVPVMKLNLGKILEQIDAPLGTWAIAGNHEFIGGADACIPYLKSHGIRMLEDTSVLVDSSFWLCGRYDRDMPRFTGRSRKSLEHLLESTDRSYPVILLDHQPFHLDSAASLGVDLQLSGHTHNGQIFPLNLITRSIYKPDWGYRKNGGTQYYVSCGVGTWGPPMRIGNRPEIVNIRIHFE